MSRFRRLTLVGIITLAGSSILHCGNKEENKENPRPIAYRSIQQIDSVDSQPSLDSQFRADEQELWLPEQEYGWWITDQDIDPAAYSKELLNKEISPISPDRAAAPWRTIQVPGNIATAFPEMDDFTGEFWYRKLLYVNDPSDVPVALELGIIGDRDVLYVNGVQVGQTGTWDAAGPQAYDRERVYVLPENILNRNGLNVILIKVRGYFTYEAGILKDHTRITPAAAALRDFYLTGLLNVLVLVVYFSVGSYFLFLFVRRRVERENLYFALFAYALVAYQFLRTQIKYEIGLDLLLLKRVEYLALSGMAPLLYTFVRNYFHLPARGYFKWQDRFMYLPIAIAAALAVMVMVSSDINDWNWFNNTFYLPTFGVYVIVLLVIIAYSIYKGDRDAIYMMIGILFFMIAIGVDTATHLNYLNIPRILGYVFIMFVLSLSLILANRFVRLSIQVEDLNRNLEKKVEQRTEELRNTLKEVRTLKEQQDGDYFLTSLLVRPLGGDYSRSEFVNVSMVERQKKKFTFRGRNSEIGGDLNLAQDIQLYGRNYTAFLNGDAMGKSIQGAGGALVLGTVFRSILNRTLQSSQMQQRHPEQWLKQSFLELQDTFVTFDGSMLISLVMGLVEESTGLVYYINAEHPWVALYRNGKASFIEDDLSLRKIGVEGLNGQLIIKTFAMQPEDVLIIGSDGRDDILLGHEENGTRIINEDEQQFLRRIEDGRGRLEGIEQAILAQGELTDDFTLIRISYREGIHEPEQTDLNHSKQEAARAKALYKEGRRSEALKLVDELMKQDRLHPEAVRAVARICIREKQFDRARDLCLRVTEELPTDSNFLYYTSYVLKHLQEYEAAADFGERCRLREPQNVQNLVNLADIYRLMGNEQRAEMLIDLARNINPDHDHVKQYLAAVQR